MTNKQKTMSVIPSEWDYIGNNGATYFYKKKSDGKIMAEMKSDDCYWTYYWCDENCEITEYIGDYQGVFGIFGAEDHYETLFDGGRRETDENEIILK